MKMQAFEVRYYGEQLEAEPEYGSAPCELIRWLGYDVVFYSADHSPVAVKRSLIEHDDYPEQIYVKRQAGR